MSEPKGPRLTVDELVELERQFGPSLYVTALVSEVRERRAADLDPEDIILIAWIIQLCQAGIFEGHEAAGDGMREHAQRCRESVVLLARILVAHGANP